MVERKSDMRFGRLTARWPEGIKGKHHIWLFSCSCGVLVHAYVENVEHGRTKSCGCLNHENRVGKRTHGMSKSVEYAAYREAWRRCTLKTHRKWNDYGGRGIEFRFTCFADFLKAVGRKPHPSLVLDRIDNDGHYEAGNLRWATASESNINRRPFKRGCRRF